VSARDKEAVARLCRVDLDLVSVHSPPFLHVGHVGLALAEGHAVLCDKPFGLNLNEAETMAAAADVAGVINLVNFEFRHQPARVAMRRLLDSGVIGTPEHLHFTAFTSGSRVPLRPYGWLFDRGRGGGWIGAFGSHAIDTFRWLLGAEVTDAGAVTWTTIPERPDTTGRWQACDAEDAFSAWFEFSNGTTATLDTSFTAVVSPAPRIVVTGSEGTIENTGDTRLVVRGTDRQSQQYDFEPSRGDPHLAAMSGWVDAICRAVFEQEPIAPSFADGVACARVMERLRATPPRIRPVSTQIESEGANREL
jgi:predicted dehydrogenase